MYFIIVIAISALISYIAFKIYQSIRVPEELKNIPTLSFFNFLNSIVNNGGSDKSWEDSREILEKEGIGKVILFFSF